MMAGLEIHPTKASVLPGGDGRDGQEKREEGCFHIEDIEDIFRIRFIAKGACERVA